MICNEMIPYISFFLIKCNHFCKTKFSVGQISLFQWITISNVTSFVKKTFQLEVRGSDETDYSFLYEMYQLCENNWKLGEDCDEMNGYVAK